MHSLLFGLSIIWVVFSLYHFGLYQPVLLPGKSHGWRSLVGCGPWVAKSRTRLSDFTFTFHFHTLEKEMATHSSVFAWSIPGTGEPGGLPSMGSHRVRHDWRDLAAAAAATFLPRWHSGKESVCQFGFDTWVGKSPGEKNDNTIQGISCLKNFVVRGAWRATVLGSQRVERDWATEHAHRRAHSPHCWWAEFAAVTYICAPVL